MQPPDNEAPLESLRSSLDSVDSELVRLIAKRLELVGSIGEAKSASLSNLRQPQRELEVLERAQAAARELGVSAPFVRKLFSDIISHALARQTAVLVEGAAPAQELRVAYQGVAHANSYLAAQSHFAARGLSVHLTGFRSFRGAVDELLAGSADLAFLPIENTTAGSINQVYDLLRETDLHIVGEEVWKVEHCLAAPADVPLASLRKIFSHPQALEQCSLFLHQLPQIEAVPYFDTAEAMQAVAKTENPAHAAIGPAEAAGAYGLVVLQRGIANQRENYTRFVALSPTPGHFDPRIACKTSLILTTRHERGALGRCLEILSSHGLSLTKLESRPRPGRPWEYMFFLDLEGNVADPQTTEAIEELRVAALYLKVLGSYPAKATPQLTQATAVSLAPSEEPEASARSQESVAPPAATKKAVLRSKNYRLADRASHPEDTIVRVGDLLIGGGGFVVMAGPCAVESEEQIRATANHVRSRGAHVLRGGVFKPRTSPYSFQGLGLEGLEIMAAAGHEAGMPIVTEVMAPDQVRPVAAKADILQIGARNMQNFDLLREVGKVDRPVMLKRGLSSTIEEWLAAAEYILAQGNGQVILCERGIRTFENATRNTLDLSAVVVLRERTHLPVIVDPSHGTGRRDYVAPMAYAARACGAHGILVEVHPNPDQALSDGDQSLSFEEFSALIEGLRRVQP